MSRLEIVLRDTVNNDLAAGPEVFLPQDVDASRARFVCDDDDRVFSSIAKSIADHSQLVGGIFNGVVEHPHRLRRYSLSTKDLPVEISFVGIADPQNF